MILRATCRRRLRYFVLSLAIRRARPRLRVEALAALADSDFPDPSRTHRRLADYPSAETGSGADGPVVALAGWDAKHGALKREEEAP